MPAEFNPHRSLRLAEAATPGDWEVGGPWPSVTVIVCVDGGSSGPDAEPPMYEPVAYLHQAVDYKKPPPPQAEADAAHIADARTALPEACRRLIACEPLGPNIAENLQVIESDGDLDFVLIRIPLAQAREILAALTWEETTDG